MKKNSHTNNINILPDDNTIIFRQIDQNIRIRVNTGALPSSDECLSGGEYYIGGDDAEDTLTDRDGTDPDLPFSTFTFFRNNILKCKHITGPIIVRIRAGTYAETMRLDGLLFASAGRLTIMATDEEELSSNSILLCFVPLLGAALDPITVEDSTISITIPTDTMDLSETLIEDAFIGKRIRVVSGTGSDQCRGIMSNTTDGTFTIDRPWTTNPIVGDSEIAVEEPGVVFAPAAGLPSYLFNGLFGSSLHNQIDITEDFTDAIDDYQIQIIGIKFVSVGAAEDFPELDLDLEDWVE